MSTIVRTKHIKNKSYITIVMIPSIMIFTNKDVLFNLKQMQINVLSIINPITDDLSIIKRHLTRNYHNRRGI